VYTIRTLQVRRTRETREIDTPRPRSETNNPPRNHRRSRVVTQLLSSLSLIIYTYIYDRHRGVAFGDFECGIFNKTRARQANKKRNLIMYAIVSRVGFTLVSVVRTGIYHIIMAITIKTYEYRIIIIITVVLLFIISTGRLADGHRKGSRSCARNFFSRVEYYRHGRCSLLSPPVSRGNLSFRHSDIVLYRFGHTLYVYIYIIIANIQITVHARVDCPETGGRIRYTSIVHNNVADRP